jgi:hypothetical protein
MEHRMRGILMLLTVVLFPVYLGIQLFPALVDGVRRGADMWWYELRMLWAWPKGGDDA